MLASIVIPAYEAERTIIRAVSSLINQSWCDWEAIVVSDDGKDYAAVLEAGGVSDERVRFISTGAIRSGCHNARNAGLAQARGDVIGALDADDLFYCDRIAALYPLAIKYGAAADNIAVVCDPGGELLYRAIDGEEPLLRLTAGAFLRLTVPIFPLVRRDIAEPRLAGIEYAEDVIANLRLIDRVGTLPILPETFSEYRVVAGSMCHDENSGSIFDEVYEDLIRRLDDPADGLGLTAKTKQASLGGLKRKRALNADFSKAKKKHPSLNFQTFVASRKQRPFRELPVHA